MKTLNHVVSTTSAILVILLEDGKATPVQIPRDDPRHDRLEDWTASMALGPLSPQDEETLDNIINPPGVKEMAPEVQILAHEAIAGGQDPAAVRAFQARVLKSPGSSIRNMLYDYVSTHGVTLAEDGCCVFYKRVRFSNGNIFASCHDDTFKYRLGEWVTEARASVDLPEECGIGIHVCAAKFLNQWFATSNTTIELLVPPEDITSMVKGGSKILCRRAFVRRVGSGPIHFPVVESAADATAKNGPRRGPAKARAKVKALAPIELKLRAAGRGICTPVVTMDCLHTIGLQSTSAIRVLVTDPRSKAIYITAMKDADLVRTGLMKRQQPAFVCDASVADSFSLRVPKDVLAYKGEPANTRWTCRTATVDGKTLAALELRPVKPGSEPVLPDDRRKRRA